MWLMPDGGLVASLDTLLQGDFASAEVLLFTTFHTPAPSDVLATYTAIEAAWTGYARQSPAPFDAASIDGDGHAFSYSALLSFPVTAVAGGTVVYGYAVLLGSDLLWAELLANRPVPEAGVPVTFKVRVFLANVPVA